MQATRLTLPVPEQQSRTFPRRCGLHAGLQSGAEWLETAAGGVFQGGQEPAEAQPQSTGCGQPTEVAEGESEGAAEGKGDEEHERS